MSVWEPHYGIAPITGLVLEVVMGVVVGSSWRLYVGLGAKSGTSGSNRLIACAINSNSI